MKLLLLTLLLPFTSTFEANAPLEFLKNATKLSFDKLLDKIEKKECKDDLQAFFADLLNFKLWALKMFDANPKIPIGILSGNVVQFGDYDLCLSINETVESRQIIGQYCTLFLTQNKNILNKQGPNTLIETIEKTSNLNQNTFGFMPVGICVPKSCDIETIRQIAFFIQTSIDNFFNISLMNKMCISKDYSPPQYWTDFYIFLLFGGILLATAASTLYDYKFKERGKRVYRVFSLIKNGKLLLSTRKSDFAFLYGIRVFLTTWVFYGHALSVLSFVACYNPVEVQQWSRGLHTIHLYPSIYSVDCFFTLSGLLTAYHYLQTSETQIIKLSQFYFNRFAKIFPAVFVVVLIHIGPFKYFGNGPFWPLVTQKIADSCAENWWSTLTFTSNWVVDADCLGESWSLSVDTQLYLIAPFVLMILKKKAKIAIKGMAVATILSIAYTFVATLLGNYSIRDMFIPNRDFKWYVYFSTFGRLPVWLLGIVTGYVLHHHKKQPLKLSPFVSNILWTFSCVSIATVASLLMVFLHTETTGIRYGLYLVTGRLFWCLGLCIMVFLLFNENLTNNQSVINSILSCKAFQILFKLGYTIYLIHLTTLIWLNSTNRHPWYFSNLSLFQNVLSAYVIVLILATIIWLLVEAPFIELAKCLWPPSKNVEKKTD